MLKERKLTEYQFQNNYLKKHLIERLVDPISKAIETYYKPKTVGSGYSRKS